MLEEFSEDERDLLIALPYRAGLWVGASDESGGDESDEAELNALACIVTGFAEDFCKSEFVEELMRATLARKEKWPSWQENLQDVPEECRRALDVMAGYMDAKNILSFKHNIMEIAMAVAMAYREFDETYPLSEKIRMYTDYFIRKVKALIAGEEPPTLDEILNVSRGEQEALNELATALQYEVKDEIDV